MKNMISTVINIGDELMSGKRVNTNASDMGRFLMGFGHKLSSIESIPDNSSAIVSTLEKWVNKADLVLITGGLGPTRDDTTRESVAQFLKTELLESPQALVWVKDFLKKKGKAYSENQKKQIYIPMGALPLRNKVGTACGISFLRGRTQYMLFPGVPSEVRQMLTDHVKPLLLGQNLKLEKQLWTWDWSESRQEEAFKDFSLPKNYNFSSLPSLQGVQISLSTICSKNSAQLKKEKQNFSKHWKKLLSCVPAHLLVRPVGLTALEAIAQKLLKSKKKVAVAESCTGGLLAAEFTSRPGSSDYFEAGYVTYSNNAKQKILKVPASLLDKHGAVSEAVVKAMVKGCLKASGADYALATSGIAGPGGGTVQKPVGTVWLAYGSSEKVESRLLQLKGSRSQIQIRTVQQLLFDLNQFLEKILK